MQHPVGYTINEEAGRAELTDFLAVLTNSTAVITFPHTMAAAFLTTGAFITGIAMWRLVKGRANPDVERPFRAAAKAGAWMLLISGVAVAVTGDIQGKIMTEQQPMKMAAAEALWETEQPASFSIFTIGTLDGSEEVFSVRIPYLLSFLATGDFNGRVEGINDLQKMEEQQFGPGDYTPNLPVTYWTFRWMIGMGALAAVAAAWFLWKLRRGGVPSRGAVAIAVTLPFLPLLANSFGWIFTEVGRQPWIVYGLMFTAPAVTPTNPAWQVALTMIGFTLLYGLLAVIMLALVVRRVRDGLPPPTSDTGFEHEAEPIPALGY